MDSLLAVRLRSFVTQLLKKASLDVAVPRNVVYEYPSIAALERFILDCISSQRIGSSNHDDIKDRIRQLVGKYTANFRLRFSDNDDEYEGIVLTGSTGSLGTFLLDQLLDRISVQRVYCFNRRGEVDTFQRQLAAFREKGLDTGKLERERTSGRVIFVDVDLSLGKLGLSDVEYEEVLHSPSSPNAFANSQ